MRHAVQLQTPASTDEILTISQVAPFLASCVRTARRWTELPDNPLPVHRAPGGRRLLFLRSEVLAWLASCVDRPTLRTPRRVRRAAKTARATAAK